MGDQVSKSTTGDGVRIWRRPTGYIVRCGGRYYQLAETRDGVAVIGLRRTMDRAEFEDAVSVLLALLKRMDRGE